jgi:putative transposase
VDKGVIMARRPRIYIPGVAHHLIQRGNNREACFYEEADYKTYLSHLREVADQFSVAIHSFVLMTNHVHLLVTPNDANALARIMQALGRRYVQFFNHKYSRTGTLWEGRYKSTLVQSEQYLLTVYRYIELNPVRARMVSHASEYPWSSYRFNAVGLNIQLITPHLEYLKLGNTAEKRQQAYRGLFRGRMAEKDIVEIQDCTNKAWVLGSDHFKRQIETKTGIQSQRIGRGGDRKSAKYQKKQNQ